MAERGGWAGLGLSLLLLFPRSSRKYEINRNYHYLESRSRRPREPLELTHRQEGILSASALSGPDEDQIK